MTRYIVYGLLAILIAAMVPQFVEPEDVDPLYTLDNKGEYMVWTNIVATRYQISSAKLKLVMKKESGYNPAAIGDGGNAKRILQFHDGTWYAFARQYEQETGEKLVYGNTKDDITLAAWAFHKGYGHHWTTY